MIALITPTGGRPKQIELCAEFMRRQYYKGKVLWIIVDDVLPITTGAIEDEFRKDWQIIKVHPQNKWSDGMNTQSQNLLRATDLLKWFTIECIFIIEDDDYYSQRYLSVMMSKLSDYDVIGQQYTVYYDVVHKGWFQNGNDKHASLFQVAFTPKALPAFEATCRTGNRYIDMNFFRAVKGMKANLFDGKELAVGVKGLPGRKGIGMGHRMDLKMIPDPELVKLRDLIGEDYTYYL